MLTPRKWPRAGMTVPAGTTKRTAPSEAASAQPAEPSVVPTMRGTSELLYNSTNSSFACGDVSGAPGVGDEDSIAAPRAPLAAPVRVN